MLMKAAGRGRRLSASFRRRTFGAGLTTLHRLAHFVRRGRWLHPIFDELPHRHDDENNDDGCDNQPLMRGHCHLKAPIMHPTNYSERVSIRSARPKSSSVNPPLLWVESINR